MIATSDEQHPIRNKIGAAIVERILRAARAGEKYKMIILIPAVPGFAGDLRSDAALATRAIMEFQYKSINRGGYSIMETIALAGFDPLEYIRFYNLRNYDRINSSAVMREAEQRSGVSYEEARKQHDDVDGPGFRGTGAGINTQYNQAPLVERYQEGARKVDNRSGLASVRWDSVVDSYMLNGTDIRDVPWEDGNLAEIDAFVSEELYIHTKVSGSPHAISNLNLTCSIAILSRNTLRIRSFFQLRERR